MSSNSGYSIVDRRRLRLRVARIADEMGLTIDEVNAALDAHPIHTNRTDYLRRELTLELLHLDELEEAFRHSAVLDVNVSAGSLLLKIAERRATLMGMNAPLGHAVHVIHHQADNQISTTKRIEAAINGLLEKPNGQEQTASGDDTGCLSPASDRNDLDA